MKVLFITSTPSPYRKAWCNCLGRLCDLTVLYERKYAEERNKTWQDSVKTENFREIYLRGIKVGAYRGFCPSVTKYLDSKLFDVFLLGGYSSPTRMLSIMKLKRKKIPFFLTVDGGLVNNESVIKYRTKRFFLSRASEWLSSGTATDKYLLYYGARRDHIHRYPFTSVEADYIEKKPAEKAEKQELRKYFGIEEEKVVLTVGQFIYRKGFDILIKAAKNLGENTGIYIVGGEPTGEYLSLERQYEARNVHYIKFLDHSELKNLYKASDLFVLPTREDIWGLVINEAMSNGLPIITTTNCVAGLELVEDYKNGFITPVEDIESLSEKINLILNNECLRQQMAHESLNKIRPYSIENMAQVNFEIFKRFLKHSSKGC